MNTYRLGIDIGSTTAKIVLLDDAGGMVCSDYVRHNTRIAETLLEILDRLHTQFGNITVQPALSGSAAMGIAESIHVAFIQEIIAASSLVSKKYPDAKSLIDIGGEDAKLVLFHDFRTPDIRMNGNCAGGTGAYIDQMAALLNVSIEELDALAWQSTKNYPIASRCGVFAKTDVQNLISRKINTADIAASVFDAVAGQTLNTLARGCTVEPSVIFCGGPLTYISYLRRSFARLLNIDEKNIIVPERAELFTAYGAALSVPASQKSIPLSDFTVMLKAMEYKSSENNTLDALFGDHEEKVDWEKNRYIIKLPEAEVKNGETCFLGIDSGSTTTKILILNENNEAVFHYYRNNEGKPLETVVQGLKEFSALLDSKHFKIKIGRSAVTGYGEDLIKSALGLDFGVVETVSHFIAAKHLDPEVSFILDIGGQDIKAIFVQNNIITNIEINEACSSGCGSFIEGFAHTLGYTPSGFAALAIQSEAPYDLGSRCTVFMNSKVKQALRDGATVSDLSAGLAYSVIKNCLNKVLRIKSFTDIGESIVVQGGTFRNDAVFRSLEILSGKKIVVSDNPELMGAYGVALYAKSKTDETESGFVGFHNLGKVTDYSTKLSACKGCTNHCQITVHNFRNGNVCYSGNKCEKIFTNNPAAITKGENIFSFKRKVLFATENLEKSDRRINIGIPRILNIYENYPFWQTLLSECGFHVVLSDESNFALYRKGTGAIMSDNICFPAKLAHGHIVNLIEKNVDRIFFPFVVYEKKEFETSSNSFNCPIVTAYSEVLKSTSLVADYAGIQFDSPCFNFNDVVLLKKSCKNYMKGLGVPSDIFATAFENALKAQENFRASIREKNKEIYRQSVDSGKPVVLVASHPYHIDSLVHQQVSQILSDLGVNVINEEVACDDKNEGFRGFFTISQWEYPNRILQAAWWVSQQKHDVGLIQLNSFGCGPDSFIIDEVNDISKRFDISFALVRIDEISSPGSIRLRLRSLVESLRLKAERKRHSLKKHDKIKAASFQKKDAGRTILVPWFSDFYSPFIPVLAEKAGYKMVNLPPSDKQSVDLGLEYANNEVCYPATLVVGDILKALKSNEYDLNNIAIGITQTGGQCRATNYIALIKRAMMNAGFSDVPVISVAASDGLHNLQPGFVPNWSKILKPTFIALLFIDSLSRMYYSTVCREKKRGETDQLRQKYMDACQELLLENNTRSMLSLLHAAVNDFNAVEVTNTEVNTVGIVGEIYIKYNSFGQFNIVDWMVENRIEVIVPPLMEFFTQAFVNSKAHRKEYIERKSFSFITAFLEWRANNITGRFENVLKKFKYYRPVHSIRHEAELAAEILKLNNQYGEGWLIPAEIASFAQQDVKNIICIQPFGCIANHIIGKGMEKKIKSLYPDLNLLFLDFDYGTSKVNVLNRLHFLIQNASLQEA